MRATLFKDTLIIAELPGKVNAPIPGLKIMTSWFVL
jgi:hypothetical protein